MYTLVGTATNEDEEVISTLVFEGAGTELEGGKVTWGRHVRPLAVEPHLFAVP